MANEELVELASSVAKNMVRAKALGEDGVVATLQMALDELLGRLADEREGVAPLNSELQEVSGL